MVYSGSDAATRADAADADRLDAVFAALAHRSRRDLVLYLAARSDAPRMSQVAADRGVSPQLLNKHTAALEKAGLVRREGGGRERRLVLDAVALTEAQQWIARAREYWTARLDALDAYVATLGGDRDA
ncbi:metalloregulator ArsR/SmtB family transcription factor [Agromyces tropicus]|uniref:Metalloregulator ArsR/SmtB family transcription factor n=1 Tax=Agromyces tropicus TaxID=555371 RepID=A0ABN2U798_9MICO